MADAEGLEQEKLTFWQRFVLRAVRREAGRGGEEPMAAEDWAAEYRLSTNPAARAMRRLLIALPQSPRCGRCGAPFAGLDGRIVGPLGYRPSRKNPTICAVCVESSPPGGMKTYTGVLFADIRGFTAQTEGADPEKTSLLLRRFYRCAEDVLFPEAIIDKLIGDEVMALYLPDVQLRIGRDEVASLMLEHARGLLQAVGYGSEEGPFLQLGIGVDVGEAFVGNIGDRALYDFTAVGDVVNTASRLQSEAKGGEIVLSGRVAERLAEPAGDREELTLKGKGEPEVAYRVAV